MVYYILYRIKYWVKFKFYFSFNIHAFSFTRYGNKKLFSQFFKGKEAAGNLSISFFGIFCFYFIYKYYSNKNYSNLSFWLKYLWNLLNNLFFKFGCRCWDTRH